MEFSDIGALTWKDPLWAQYNEYMKFFFIFSSIFFRNEHLDK